MLHAGILAGRRSFGNVLKYLLMGTSSNFGNMFSMAGAALFLPFLPMLPTQILLNNFLYDLAQITIPTDNVDPAYIRRPQRWNIRLIRNFMLVIGPVSSAYDFLTFYVLLHVFHFGETLFHTGWFVESLATQTLVLFVIRTTGRPWSNRPSLPLTITAFAVVAIGCVLPVHGRRRYPRLGAAAGGLFPVSGGGRRDVSRDRRAGETPGDAAARPAGRHHRAGAAGVAARPFRKLDTSPSSRSIGVFFA